MAAVLVVGVGDAMLLIVPTMSLSLGGVAFTVAVVDARALILSVELGAEVVLVDLLLIFLGMCGVMTRLGTVS